ncbi:MAG TPA: YdeI/OmpD-associated family protein [Gaiellaceae bacterium]|nr:YdeI/OmpD-associated family protein [Gaiellaceae bacterium]
MPERFQTTLQVEGRTATFFEVPLDVPAVFGRARPPVPVTIGGHTYRSTIAVYGGRYFVPLNRQNREAAGVAAGDEVTVELEADTDERTVTVPDDLRAALDGDEPARAAFDALSYTHRREYVEWIAEAKRQETRRRRVEQTVERLRSGD